MLMQHPHDLLRVRNQVSRKLQRNQAVDPGAVNFRQVEKAARQHLIRDPLRDRRIERHRNDFRFVAGPDQRRSQSGGVRLRPAGDERYLHRGNDDAHGGQECVSETAGAVAVSKSARRLRTPARSPDKAAISLAICLFTASNALKASIKASLIAPWFRRSRRSGLIVSMSFLFRARLSDWRALLKSKPG